MSTVTEEFLRTNLKLSLGRISASERALLLVTASSHLVELPTLNSPGETPKDGVMLVFTCDQATDLNEVSMRPRTKPRTS